MLLLASLALVSASRVRSKPAVPRARSNTTSWLAGSRSEGLRVPPPCAIDTTLCVKSTVTSRHFFHFFMGEMLPFVEWLAEQPCLPKVGVQTGGVADAEGRASLTTAPRASCSR